MFNLQRLSVAAVLALTAVGAPHASTSDVFAIRDARLVTVSGAPIDAGTIVIARGVISAVGANAPIPAGAWVIDGKGLTVYPGLIDASTDLGLSTGAATPPSGGRPGPSRRRCRAPDDCRRRGDRKTGRPRRRGCRRPTI